MGGKKLITKVRYDMALSNLDQIYCLSQVVADSSENALLFKTRCLDLETLFLDFRELHVQLASESGSEFDLDKHMIKFNEISNSYYKSKAKYAELFNTMELPKASSNNNNCSTSQSHKPNLLLPKVQIPNFNGKIEEYEYFMDLFLAMVGNDDNLSDTQKIYYLCGSLSGEARSLVQHLSITGENYPVVLDILKSRYGNTRLQADKLLNTLMAASPVNKSLGSLKLFLNLLLETTKGLQKLKFPIAEWSYLLLYINLNKLDITMRRQFEDKFGSGPELPTFENLLTFLTKEVQTLETTNTTKGTSSTPQHKVHVSYINNPTQKQSIKCVCCNGSHYLNQCEKFTKLNVGSRKQFIIDNRLCFRCFHRHNITDCRVKLSCDKCTSKRHNSLIHMDEGPVVNGPTSSDRSKPGTGNSRLGLPTVGKPEMVNVLHSASVGARRTVLLSTAVVHILDKYGNYHEARALLDSGSQSTFVTEKFISRLGLQIKRTGSINVQGVGGNILSGCKGHVTLRITPRHMDKPMLVTTGLVLNKVVDNLPSWSLPCHLADCYPGLQLADDQFYKSAKVDILIGADLLGDIFLGGEIVRPVGLPCAMNTIFGYILQGTFQDSMEPNLNVHAYFAQTDAILEKFFEMEDVPTKMVDPKTKECESHFERTHQRNETGRYVLRLPFTEDSPELGDSQKQALRRFHSMEKRLQSDQLLRDKYVEFMREYRDLGHMVPFSGDLSVQHYVIPHHGIFKSGSEKIRVVFDASCPTSTGVSLNDCLHAGPKLQHDVMQVICRFRLHKIAFSTDIRMMYRMIDIQQEDQRYQLIFWRESPELPLQLFALTTVTYGMKCSPYLAIRTLRQLADDESRSPNGKADDVEIGHSELAEAAQVLRTSVYMDDILSGASNLTEAQNLKAEIIRLLSLGGFELRKWMSNDKRLLKDIPTEHQEKPHVFNTDGPGYIKILGVQWNPVADDFTYHTKLDLNKQWTKRAILSVLARMFDPMGWITPVILQGKILLQQIWLLKLSWDEYPPPEVLKEWNHIFNKLPALEDIKINRFVLADEVVHCALHGFADASERAFGAAVYIKTVDKVGQTKVCLMMAKSKVAPIKSKLTIPKLELSAAALVVKLLKYVLDSIKDKITVQEIIGWSDSTIVLSWLKYPPHRLQTFEGNRVLQINNSGLVIDWRYVPSEMNPADVASRGCKGHELVSHELWWGPTWLSLEKNDWPANIMNKVDTLPGLRKEAVTTVSAVAVPDTSLISRYSSLSTLIAVAAYCIRFSFNCRNPNNRVSGPLSVAERKQALEKLVRLVQAEAFSKDIALISNNRNCSTGLQRLKPFIDDSGLLRVGGRLERSSLPYEAKHPLLLPKAHALTSLIIIHHHQMYCHVGATALQAILQKHYWIISARQAIRSHLFKCIRCFKTKAKADEPFMSDLPADRINATGLFHTVQTDFAGPFLIKVSRLRQAKVLKTYLCVFVCSATKAVHLEMVGDLTTEGFLSAFSRFTSRRGLPQRIRSDCGTNYVGSSRHLTEVQQFLRSKEIQNTLSHQTSQTGVIWQFNPPAASHFGGLFEAAVKSAKTLLKRVIGDQTLTTEEFSTLIARIEAVLNSRPLCPLSQDSCNFEVLTPAHFIIGRSLLAVPEYDWHHIPDSRLNRYQLITAMSQRFWLKWSEQYLHTLQMRHKWKSDVDPPKVGDLVLIKDENLPPLKWRMARIKELLPGRDGVPRVVTLITATGSLVRPTVKICRLPLN